MLPYVLCLVNTPPSTCCCKSVWKVFLRAFGEDKAKIRQCCFIFCDCTVLDFQGHRLSKLAGCWDPEDRAKEVWVLGKLKLPRETHSDVDPALSHASWKTVFGDMKSQSIPLPLKCASFSRNCELFFPSHFCSMNGIWKTWIKDSFYIMPFSVDFWYTVCPQY